MNWSDFRVGEFVYHPERDLAYLVETTNNYHVLCFKCRKIHRRFSVHLRGVGHYFHEVLFRHFETLNILSESVPECLEQFRQMHDIKEEVCRVDVPGAELVFRPLAPEQARRIVGQMRERMAAIQASARPMVFPVEGDAPREFRARGGGQVAASRRRNKEKEMLAKLAAFENKEQAKGFESGDNSGSAAGED